MELDELLESIRTQVGSRSQVVDEIVLELQQHAGDLGVLLKRAEVSRVALLIGYQHSNALPTEIRETFGKLQSCVERMQQELKSFESTDEATEDEEPIVGVVLETAEVVPTATVDLSPEERAQVSDHIREHGPILFVGGARFDRRTTMLCEWLGIEPQHVEWLMCDRKGSLQSGVERIRNGRITAVFLMDGIINHSSTGPVREATRTGKVPLFYVGKAEVESIRRAVRDLAKVVVNAGATA